LTFARFPLCLFSSRATWLIKGDPAGRPYKSIIATCEDKSKKQYPKLPARGTEVNAEAKLHPADHAWNNPQAGFSAQSANLPVTAALALIPHDLT
jgi:hypothetical protein